MIRCYYWPRELRLVMSGHAPKNTEKNKQQCAAASALLYALIGAVHGFTRKGWANPFKTYTFADSGIAVVKIKAARLRFKTCRVAIGMVFGGLMMMADKYPQAVHTQVCTGIPFDDKKVLSGDAEGGVSYLQKFLYDIRKGSLTKGQKGTENEKKA